MRLYTGEGTQTSGMHGLDFSLFHTPHAERSVMPLQHPFLPQLPPALTWESPSSPGGSDGVCPGEHRAAASRFLQESGFVEQIFLLSCGVSPEQAGTCKGEHRAGGST